MKTLLHNIHQYNLFTPDETLIVAVSGGMDSLSLAHWLVHRGHFNIHIATYDHDLREGSAEDARFVAEICAGWGVPCTVGKMTDRPQTAIEATARRARYRFLADVARRHGATKVITAHHADDQAETILLHLIRGAGLQGAAGMDWVSVLPGAPDLRVIRPLLNTTRDDIEQYAAANDLSPRHDPTNDDHVFTRNRLRHAIMPLLQTINPRVVEAINRFGEAARQDLALITAIYDANVSDAIIAEQVAYTRIDRAKFKVLHPAIQRRLLHDILTRRGLTTVTLTHLFNAATLAEVGAVGAIAEFEGADSLYVDYEQLIVGDYHAYFASMRIFALSSGTIHRIEVGENHFGENWRLIVTEYDSDDVALRLYLPDSAQMTLRTRRPADRFAPVGLGGKQQKIKNWMINRKISRQIRDIIPLLLVNGEVAAILYGEKWVASARFSQKNDQKNRLFYFFGNFFDD